ncbi:hypothetical protein [Agromyces mariniharenae]|uniref:Uncharacterized protein n=1 Tax=Agromyces mariniharenae TaxID=2604423 RepID=A0A5S4VAS6_9MICO|nr:hypothetical protein [Agromyces mariniharenae]TYL51165.1 hypothetical protein FYC51_18790 [Agromyces mariniharenae]
MSGIHGIGRAWGAAMPKWQRLTRIGVLLFLTVTPTVSPLGASMAASANPEVVLGRAVATDAADECATFSAGSNSAAAGAKVLELFSAAGSDADVVAAQVVGCLATQTSLDADERTMAACDAASTLSLANRHADAAALIKAYQAVQGSTEACDVQLSSAEAELSPTAPEDLEELWTSFDEEVLQALLPIVSFVGLSALAIIALGRLTILIDPFRNLRSNPVTRSMAWFLGLLLALLTPTIFVVRGLWLMRTEELSQVAIPLSPWQLFVDLLGSPSPEWWLLLIGAGLAVLLLGYAFATTRSTHITITSSKGEGEVLDSARLMATIDAVAGRPDRGLEFPVGTDIETAADSVSNLSENKAVAAVQSLVKVVFGSTPWNLGVENESAEAVSLAVSRNGKLLVAKRLRLSDYSSLSTMELPSKADRLAALVAGEFVAAMRDQYRWEFDPGLHGATSAQSIALHYLASAQLQAETTDPDEWRPTLMRAVALDPANRAASATLRFITDRFATGPDLERYRKRLTQVLHDELELTRHGRTRIKYGLGFDSARRDDIVEDAMATPVRRLRRNDLLIRIAQSLVAVERNCIAQADARAGEIDTAPLLTYLLKVRGNRSANPILTNKRRMLADITLFLTDCQDGSLEPPAELRRAERKAWNEARPLKPKGLAIERLVCEEAALAIYGDFRNVPDVCYSLACRRAMGGFTRSDDSIESMESLLKVAFRRPYNREWAPRDPELADYYRANKPEVDLWIREAVAATPRPKPKPKPKLKGQTPSLRSSPIRRRVTEH